jgi:hypothetical protein
MGELVQDGSARGDKEVQTVGLNQVVQFQGLVGTRRDNKQEMSYVLWNRFPVQIR